MCGSKILCLCHGHWKSKSISLCSFSSSKYEIIQLRLWRRNFTTVETLWKDESKQDLDLPGTPQVARFPQHYVGYRHADTSFPLHRFCHRIHLRMQFTQGGSGSSKGSKHTASEAEMVLQATWQPTQIQNRQENNQKKKPKKNWNASKRSSKPDSEISHHNLSSNERRLEYLATVSVRSIKIRRSERMLESASSKYFGANKKILERTGLLQPQQAAKTTLTHFFFSCGVAELNMLQTSETLVEISPRFTLFCCLGFGHLHLQGKTFFTFTALIQPQSQV